MNHKIKRVQSNCGGEYRVLTQFFNTLGIYNFVSCPHTPEQSGVVERKPRHIVETGLTFLAQVNMAQKFWDDVLFSGTYLINRLPSSVLNFMSPYEKLLNRKPNYNMLKVFLCQWFP